ncbi:hypothetical protein SmJEL517_g02756 [Synchytrium microbalum]|uniref:EF-hand domain-containing protein n=1 Tax=Synchytrium microbalum TaxID=1806994 RepID=A0A507C0Y6_9FUNG|nr:uncharacterized protein SmJEL517_g02756 [Synchytrium microbalum]TPX34757.1 hypothetical protein SmJEL517_g02756 [Synchytrium microbalum]
MSSSHIRFGLRRLLFSSWPSRHAFLVAGLVSGYVLHRKTVSTEASLDPAKNSVVASYEDRIRKYSHPQKVFSYFASERRDGTPYMTIQDLIRSLTPSKATSSTEQKPIPPESLSFFKLADIDADGLISFEEYLFFLALLSTGEASWKVAFRLFDEDGNGVVSLREFKKIVSSNMRATSAKSLGSRERIDLSSSTSLLRLFFGERGEKTLSLDEFASFMSRLHTEVSRLEFSQYVESDASDNSISVVDFGRAVVAYDARPERYVKRLESRSNGGEDGGGARVTFFEFLNFDSMVRNYLNEIEVAVKLYGRNGLDRDKLTRIIRTVAYTSLTPSQMDAIFYMFDPSRSGKAIDGEELCNVLRKRVARNLDGPRSTQWGVGEFLGKLRDCISS